MYKTKKEVDAHVRTALAKIRTETERHLRSFTIAKLYYKVNEFATAEQYLCSYLSVKEDNDQAHKLLGQCYQRLKKPDKALQSFQRSLQLNPKQSDILAEVCQLLLEDKNLNTNKAKYWCELAESEKVQHEAVFSLRLKLMNKENLGTNQVEELIQKEIAARPNDVQLRVRLVRNYVEKNQILDAFKYVHQLEMSQRDEFVTSGEWYNVVWLVLNKYEQMPNTKKDWDFWLLLAICLERQVQISFFLTSNSTIIGGGVTETANLLFNLDQYLFKISQLSDKFCTQKELVELFLDHYRGQLLLHASVLIFKRELLQNKNKWKETTRAVLPLLLLAFQTEAPNSKEPWMKHCDEQSKQLITLWQREGSFRCAQVGRTLLSCVDDNGVDKENAHNINNLLGSQSSGLWQSNDELLNQVRQTCSDRQWRRNIFALLFCNSDQKVKEQSSLFAKSSKLSEPIYEMPSYADVECYEDAAQYLRPQSLQHMVYLCLGNENLAYVKAKYFSGLNYSTQNLSFCGAESLNQLDVDSFLYAATIQAKRALEVDREAFNNYQSGNISALGKPKLLPFVNIQNLLCTEEQSQWWNAAYIVYKNLSSGNDLAELRANLQYGIEAVRGINGPKLDMAIAFKLGQIFLARAQDIIKPVEKAYLEARAESIYKYGLNMMKMPNEGVLESFRKYFKYVKSQTPAAECALASAAEDAVSYLATRYFKKSEYEDLIEELSGIQLPFATYLQAEAYHKLGEASDTPKKTKRMYLNHAIVCLNQCLALLKSDTHANLNHLLHSLIHSEIKRLQQTSARYLNESNTSFSPITGNNKSSTYEDEETDFYTENSIMPPVCMSNTTRSRRDTSSATVMLPSQNQEIETLVKEMANTLTLLKDEIMNNFKSELQNITKEICILKDKISSSEEAMRKITPWNDDPYQKRQQTSPKPPMGVSQSRNNDGSITNGLDMISNSPLMPQQQCLQAMLPSTNNFPLNCFSQPKQPNSYLMTPPPDDCNDRVGILPSLTHLDPAVHVSSATVNFIMATGMRVESNRPSDLLTTSVTNITSLSSSTTPLTHTSSIPAPPTTTITTTTAQSGTQSEANDTLNRISDSSDYKRSVTEEIVYDSRSDFKPLIPLPDKIEVCTGEEDEEVMFCHRAKLFRHVDKEWKERDIGDIKILKNKEGTSRILIRRDQTNKICANHSITPELILTVPKNETKGFIWAANDFAEETLILEKFFVRFKLPETAKQFQEAFQKAQKEAEDKQSAMPGKNVEKPKVASSPVTNTATTFELSKSRTTNFVISTPAPSNDDTSGPQTKSVFGQPISSTTISSTPSTTAPHSKLLFSGLNLSTKAPEAQFKPVILLPDLVKVNTGEETEIVLFFHRAKLFRFDKEAGQWKERGIGIIKLLQDNDDLNKVRLVMRREQIQKLCCNQRVYKDTSFKYAKNSQTALYWAGQDFSENELVTEMLAVRFKLPETCKQFLEIIQDAQAKMISKEEEANSQICGKKNDASESKLNKGFGDAFKPKAGSWSCNSCYISNDADQLYCVACDTFKDDTVPKKEITLNILAPSNKTKFDFNFSAASSLATLPAATQWQSSNTKPIFELITSPAISTSLLIKSNEKLSSTKPPATGGFGDAFKPKADSWKCKGCYLTNSADAIYCKSCDAPKDDTVPNKKDANTNILTVSELTEKISSTQSPATGGFGDAFKPKVDSWKCKGCYLTNSADAIDCKSCDAPKDDTVPNKKDANTNILAPSNPTEKFYFGLNFGATRPANSFKFSTAIPNGKGVMFYYRARLFHVKDMIWKDPSFGDITILRGKNGISRILIRSDLQIYANHKITHELTLNVPKNKTKGFIWTANDLTEGFLQLKNFYVHFESPKVAQRFQTAFKKAQKEAKYIQSAMPANNVEKSKVTSPSTSNTGTPFATSLVTSTREPKNVYSLGSQTQKVFGERIFGATATASSTTASTSKPLFSDLNLSTKILSSNVNSAKSRAVTTMAASPFANFTFRNWSKPCGTSSISTTTISPTVASETGAAISSTFASISKQFEKNLKKIRNEAEVKQSAMLAKNVGKSKVTSTRKSNTGIHSALAKSTATNFVTSTPAPPKNVYSLGSQTQKFFGKSIFAANATESSITASTSKSLLSDLNLSTKITSSNVNSAKPTAVTTLTLVDFTSENCADQFGIFSTAKASTDFSNLTSKSSSNVSQSLDKTGVSGGSLFGSATSTASAGESIFGGAKDSKSTFGEKSAIFGGVAAVLNSKDSTSSVDTASTKSIFGASSTTSSSIFGVKPVFGSALPSLRSSVANDTNKSIFGSSGNISQTAGNGTGSSLFGSSINTSGFSSSIFGSSSTNLPQFGSLTRVSNPVGIEFVDLSKISTASTDFSNLTTKSNSNASQSNASRSNFGKPLNGLDSLDKNSSASKINESQKSIDGGGEGAGDSNDEDCNPHYVPVIELSNKIIFGTPEEEETKLFGERAFLFRWDATNEQIKESGVGELKILLHPVKRNYRLVMRCVQIHKLVLSHAIDADFHFDNMNNNPKSFVWESPNYAESNEGELEKLAVRFCKLEIAEAFSKKLTECIDNCREREKGN